MKHSQLTQHLQPAQYQSFAQFLNEFELEGEVQQGKPLWNGRDYLDGDGDISINRTDLTEFPCIFPEKWGKGFYCGNNQLTSLYGSPKEVKGDFYCNDNELTSLEGAPREVGGSFYCDYNKLTSLEGTPKKVGGSFGCHHNETKFSEADVKKVSRVGGNIYV